MRPGLPKRTPSGKRCRALDFKWVVSSGCELNVNEADGALDAIVNQSAKGFDSPAIQGERDA